MKGLAVRTARAVNRLWGRRGSVFADRYHARVLRSPREVRNALRYVLCHAHKHGLRLDPRRPDPCSAGAWFDGWEGTSAPAGAPTAESPIVLARTWLLRIGWRHHGLIPLASVPGST